jgi:N-acetylmuramoyl-L-alanine amidase
VAQQRPPAGCRSFGAQVVLLASMCLLASGCDTGPGPGRPPAIPPSPPARATASGTAAPHRVGGAVQTRQRHPLAGKVIGIDPGHNGRNQADPAYLNHLIWNGRERETCDTTGTETDSGYTEAAFNFRTAAYLRADLRRAGARVVMTRDSNDGVGPCVTSRASILNRAHPDVAIDIHADGGPAWGRGFTVLEPVADGPNDKIVRSSARLGTDARAALLQYTPMPQSDYYGHNGVIFRDDLAGLNLATEPKILIECGNMRNSADARLLTATRFQKLLAWTFTAAITDFLRHP